jgi:hypothetical protein
MNRTVLVQLWLSGVAFGMSVVAVIMAVGLLLRWW